MVDPYQMQSVGGFNGARPAPNGCARQTLCEVSTECTPDLVRSSIFEMATTKKRVALDRGVWIALEQISKAERASLASSVPRLPRLKNSCVKLIFADSAYLPGF